MNYSLTFDIIEGFKSLIQIKYFITINPLSKIGKMIIFNISNKFRNIIEIHGTSILFNKIYDSLKPLYKTKMVFIFATSILIKYKEIIVFNQRFYKFLLIKYYEKVTNFKN